MRLSTVLARLVRAALVIGLGVVIVQVAGDLGRRARLAAVLAYAILLLVAFVFLPRWAHRAFERGDFPRASRLYRLLRPLIVDPELRAAIDVSLAGCRLATEDWTGAIAMLERIPAEDLGHSAKAAWLNNRAYARARAPLDPGAALRDIDAAMALRPDVAGFRHTRGLALLALGRVDDAIHELDSVWKKMGSDESPLLEAERCYDLGVAWQQKGEADYARDYFERVARVAPGSPWARLASGRLRSVGGRREPDELGAVGL